MSAGPERDLLFNVVWTGGVFRYLQYFAASLIDKSDARFRFVTNACTPDAVALMGRFAEAHSDRVVEVMNVSDGSMVSHGEALDIVYRQRHDGEFFCFVDADIKARAPFLAEFSELLTEHEAVTSGAEIWTDENVVPDDHIGMGLGGRHFYDRDGFVYGCPHMAMYHRSALEDTLSRWGVGFGTRGAADLPDAARARLEEIGHFYQAYDTGKVVNILLQVDGHSLRHREHPDLIHIGGMSHYLAPPDWDKRKGENGEPSWTKMRGMDERTLVARYTAALLREMSAGRPVPDMPTGLAPAMEERLKLVRHEIAHLVERYRSVAVLDEAAAPAGPEADLIR